MYAAPGSAGTDGLLKTDSRRIEPDMGDVRLDRLAEEIRVRDIGALHADGASQPTPF